jgi:hypothetical protein
MREWLWHILEIIPVFSDTDLRKTHEHFKWRFILQDFLNTELRGTIATDSKNDNKLYSPVVSVAMYEWPTKTSRIGLCLLHHRISSQVIRFATSDLLCCSPLTKGVLIWGKFREFLAQVFDPGVNLNVLLWGRISHSVSLLGPINWTSVLKQLCWACTMVIKRLLLFVWSWRCNRCLNATLWSCAQSLRVQTAVYTLQISAINKDVPNFSLLLLCCRCTQSFA